jgi:hypothetical protein
MILSWSSPSRHVASATTDRCRTGVLYFFRNRSHQTRPSHTAQTEPQISQIGSGVGQNSSNTAERNLTWREWVEWWQDRPSTGTSWKISFRASEFICTLHTVAFTQLMHLLCRVISALDAYVPIAFLPSKVGLPCDDLCKPSPSLAFPEYVASLECRWL